MIEKPKIIDLQNYFGKNTFTTTQLCKFYLTDEPNLKDSTLRWRIYNLKKQGVISSVKRGLYVVGHKASFSPQISQRIKSLYQGITKKFPYSKVSLWETKWLTNYMVHQPLTDNIIVEVDKEALSAVFSYLQESNNYVYYKPKRDIIEKYLIVGQHNLIVKNLIVDSPVAINEGIRIPKIEKIIVDLFADKDLLITYQGSELANIYQALFKTYAINQSTLNRYANIRKVKSKLIEFVITHTDIDRTNLLI